MVYFCEPLTTMKPQSTILRVCFVLPILVAHKAISTSTCRCIDTQPCWPNENEFATLASQLSQPLLYPRPPESACYPPSAPSSDCSIVIANHSNGDWRSDQPGSMQNTNFETFIFHNGTISACYLNTTLGIPCGQGSVPPVGVDARTGSDIQAAVNFAKQHNLKLVIKNTGHDYLGRSTARSGFLIWTHNMKEMLYSSTFVPEGAPVTTENIFNGDSPFVYSHFHWLIRCVRYILAVTFGAGVQWHDAYDFAQTQGQLVVGAEDASVGAAGGWVMGGGHSALSPRLGLGIPLFPLVLSFLNS